MEAFKAALDQLHISWTQRQIAQLEKYMDGVLQWNEKVNLTAITNRQMFLVKHYLDSLVFLTFDAYRNADTVIDVGTGAGFPGVPLAIMSPEKQFTLMDALAKRLKIIDELTAATAIENVRTVHARAEELARKAAYREQYAVCVSRAVANLSVLAEYCLPFVRPGGFLLAAKGPDVQQEVKEAEVAIKTLGGRIEEIAQVDLSAYGLDHRLVIIQKTKKTPSNYPRKAGKPAKAPLR